MTYPTHTEVRPRAVVFAVLPPGGENEEGELAEIKELLASADIEWAANVVQRRDHPHARSYLFPGKLADLADTVRRSEATVAVCEDDLTPAQVAAVLDAVDGVDVLDRTELILSVFARHAHSLEGTLQVHLAQLEYELTRMRGKGIILSRLGAGVDMRGPGETKLEVDRRVVRRRIQTLRRRIAHMAQTRRTQRARRLAADVPLITLAGYTNAGKSTLLNALTDADVSVRDRLFETLDPTTRGFRYCDQDYLVTDTVGFIRKLPHALVDAFASTLEETTIADLIVTVADAHEDLDVIAAHQATVAEVLETIGSADIPRLLALNKADLVDDVTRARLRNVYPDAVLISARTGENLDELRERVARFFAGRLRAVCLLIPYRQAGIVHRLRAVGAHIAEDHLPEGILVRGLLPPAEAGRYCEFAAPSDLAASSCSLEETDEATT